jgi:adenylate cyclase
LASKIASIAKPNQVLVGEHVYNIIKPSVASNSFREVNLDPAKWKYISSSDPESLYRVYEFLVNLQL